MILCGIDPGLSGAIALRDMRTGRLIVHDMPTLQLKKRSLDYHDLAAILCNAHRHSGGIGHAWVEQTWSRPGQGYAGGAQIGCYMAVLATLTTLGIPWDAVSPQKWKKALSVPAEKDGARARASQLMPDAAAQWKLKKHDGRAEAALLLTYGARLLNGISSGMAA